MSKTRKLLSIVLAFVMIFSLTVIPASAEEYDVHEHETIVEAEGDITIQPFYVASCSGGGKHAMYIKGSFVALYTGTSPSNPGTRLIQWGYGYNCSKCGLAVVCAQEVSQARILSYYSVVGYVSLSGSGYSVYCGGNYGYFVGNLATDSYWGGFDWYW